MTAPLKLYTVKETCAMLHVSDETLRQLELKKLLLPVVICRGPKGKRSLRYSEAALQRYIDRKSLSVR